MLKELELAIQKGQYPAIIQDHQDINVYIRGFPANFSSSDKYLPVYIAANADGLPSWNTLDATAGVPCKGITMQPAVDGQPIDILVFGFATNTAWGWSLGDKLYLSESDQVITDVAPVTAASIVQVVGYSVDSNTAFLDFNSSYVTLA